MKKLVLLVTTLFLIFTLTSCKDIYIEPSVISVVYENIRYNGDTILVDVYITNGKESDEDINTIDVWLEIPGTDDEVCGAGFDLYTTIPAGSYELWELEFTSEYIFISESEIFDAGYTIDEIDLMFELAE